MRDRSKAPPNSDNEEETLTPAIVNQGCKLYVDYEIDGVIYDQVLDLSFGDNGENKNVGGEPYYPVYGPRESVVQCTLKDVSYNVVYPYYHIIAPITHQVIIFTSFLHTERNVE